MIDLHTHILPNIDDGASNVEEAIKMTESLFEQNVKCAVCTPHFNPTKISMEEFVNKRTAAMKLMNYAKITLILGSETMLHDSLFYYSDISELCISRTRYLLLELPYNNKWNIKVYDQIERLITDYDVIPIIAHVERYISLVSGRKNVERLRSIGCVIQINTTSIIDKKIRTRIFKYIKLGLIDILGSDCHNMTKRSPKIADAIDIIVKISGEQYYDVLMHNAECIVNGIDIRKKLVYIIV